MPIEAGGLNVRVTADIADLERGLQKAERAIALTAAQGREAWARAGGDVNKLGQELQKMAGAASPAATGAAKVASTLQTVESGAAKASSGLNAIRGSMTAVAASAIGAAPGVTQLASAVGMMELGAGPVIGILLGLAAIATAYDHLTAKAKEAAKTQEDAIGRLLEAARKARQGVAGQAGADRDVAQQTLDEQTPRRDALQKQLDDLKGFQDLSSKSQARALQRDLDALNASMERARQAVNQGQGQVFQAMQDARDKEDAAHETAANKALARQQRVIAAAEKAARELADRVTAMWTQIERARPEGFGLGTTLVSLTGQPITGGLPVAPAIITTHMDQGNFGHPVITPDTGRSLGGRLTDVLQAGAGGSQLGQMVQAAAAFGPLAALLPIINGAMKSLAPVVEAIMKPLEMVGELLGVIIVPVLRLLEPPLRILAQAFSYVVEAIGWTIRALGHLIDKILPGKQDALTNYGQELIDGAKAARKGLDDVGASATAAAAAITNMPPIFDLVLRRRMAAAGGGGGAAPLPPGYDPTGSTGGGGGSGGSGGGQGDPAFAPPASLVVNLVNPPPNLDVERTADQVVKAIVRRLQLGGASELSLALRSA
jgi:hypothetical protein